MTLHSKPWDFKILLQEANSDIDKLVKEGLLSMAKVEWWLFKYGEPYNVSVKDFFKKYYHTLDDGTRIRLQPREAKYEYDFIYLYRDFENLSVYHKKESFFQQLVNEYKVISSNPDEVKKWVIKYEKEGVEVFESFSIKYLLYDNNPFHLSLYLSGRTDLKVFIDGNEFLNTREFSDIFDDLFWDKNVYPESEYLISLEAGMEKDKQRLFQNEESRKFDD